MIITEVDSSLALSSIRAYTRGMTYKPLQYAVSGTGSKPLKLQLCVLSKSSSTKRVQPAFNFHQQTCVNYVVHGTLLSAFRQPIWQSSSPSTNFIATQVLKKTSRPHQSRFATQIAKQICRPSAMWTDEGQNLVAGR